MTLGIGEGMYTGDARGRNRNAVRDLFGAKSGLFASRNVAWYKALRYCGFMTSGFSDRPDRPKPREFDPPLASIKSRQMGELARGDDRWDVVLESVRDEDLDGLRGRIHFISGTVHRLSGWIFLEWVERDVDSRFGEFSAQELWTLLDSLD